jgi:glycosyltransferase involved in cell wall biosynthesis
MASGMPVITTETCGMPDIVEHGVNGLLVPPADAAALENAILQLANSVALRQKLGQAGRESMRRHTWEDAGKQLEALFFRVVGWEAVEQGGPSQSTR